MNDEEIQHMIDTYLPYIDTDKARGLMMLAKEVERTTRHRAIKLASDLVIALDEMRS